MSTYRNTAIQVTTDKAKANSRRLQSKCTKTTLRWLKSF